ncbi:hypothetical protein SBF1_4980005 [Candidatus Desulfosporosinus infrequens]|uniref:Uncharacterized protein n=1 Tax=Candidatus Desulfosporosinus infrequens TaxID=2043169 RepID=A0A2U3LGS8_9FIRM|nr:hypothetical protein SBF1_4980005 [Candidatus Desulfosporosinus infrequens]
MPSLQLVVYSLRQRMFIYNILKAKLCKNTKLYCPLQFYLCIFLFQKTK